MNLLQSVPEKMMLLDWRWDWWTVEGASHSCYQEPGTVSWGPQHDVPEAVHSIGRIRELSEQSFDDGKIFVQKRNLLVLFPADSMFLPKLCLLDQFVTDRAATVIQVTWHQLASLCRYVCPVEKTQFLKPVMNSKYLSLGNCGKSCLVYKVLFMFTELKEIMDRLGQGPSHSPQRASELSDTSGDQSDKNSSPR